MAIAITGMGVVSPLGIGAGAPPGAADAGPARVDLDVVRRGLPPRGLAFMSRATLLAFRAAQVAVTDAAVSGELPAPRGLVVGTCRAHHESIVQQLRGVTSGHELRLIDGLNGGLQMVAARLAIRFATRAFAYTVPSDSAAGVDAVLEGARMLAAGRAASVLAGGVEAAGGVNGDGDAAAFLALERPAGARAGAIHGLLLGWGGCGAAGANAEERCRRGAAVVRRALAAAGASVARVLLGGGADEEAAARAGLGGLRPPVEPVAGSDRPACAPRGVLLLIMALSRAASDGGANLVLDFARGKLFAAVIAAGARQPGGASQS